MGKKRISFLAAAFVLAVLAAVLLLTFIGVSFRLDDVQLDFGRLKSYNTGWALMEDGGSEPIGALPQTLSPAGGDTLVLRNTLPADLGPADMLFLQTNYQRLRVYRNGEAIWEYGWHEAAAFGNMFGSTWHLIPLTGGKPGDELRVEITSPNNILGLRVNGAELGERSAILAARIQENVGRLLFCLLFFVIGLVSLIVVLALRMKHARYGAGGFVWLGVFQILTALWMLFDSNLPQFFMGNGAVAYLISFISFMLLPVPFLLYVDELCEHRHPWLRGLAWATLISFVMAMALYITDTLDLVYSVFLFHILLIVGIASVIVICWREYRVYRNRKFRGVLLGTSMLCVFTFACLPGFYLQRDYTRMFRWGLLLFLLLLSYSVLRHAVMLLRENAKAQMYREMAYTDTMTGLENRGAFTQKMETLCDWREEPLPIRLFLFDLDYLKQVNDTYGHAEGDCYIIAFADCIRRAFEGAGSVYRIGGDEFAVIMEQPALPETEMLEKLAVLVEEHNRTAERKIGYSYGCSEALCKTEEPLNTKQLFHQADEQLYERKRCQHEQTFNGEYR